MLDRGAIFTSLRCSLAPREVALKSLLRALGLVNKSAAAAAAAAPAPGKKEDPKAKGKPGAPAAAEPAPTDAPETTSWEGDRKVFAIHLAVDKSEFARRKGPHVTVVTPGEEKPSELHPDVQEKWEEYDAQTGFREMSSSPDQL